MDIEEIIQKKWRKKEGYHHEEYWKLFYVWAKDCGFIQPNYVPSDYLVFLAFEFKCSEELRELIELEIQMSDEGVSDAMEYQEELEQFGPEQC